MNKSYCSNRRIHKSDVIFYDRSYPKKIKANTGSNKTFCRRYFFHWTIMDSIYRDNYDLKNSEKVMWINKAVQVEYEFLKNGGRGTELREAYGKRFI